MVALMGWVWVPGASLYHLPRLSRALLSTGMPVRVCPLAWVLALEGLLRLGEVAGEAG